MGFECKTVRLLALSETTCDKLRLHFWGFSVPCLLARRENALYLKKELSWSRHLEVDMRDLFACEFIREPTICMTLGILTFCTPASLARFQLTHRIMHFFVDAVLAIEAPPLIELSSVALK